MPIGPIEIRTHCGSELPARLPDLARYVAGTGQTSPSRHPDWLLVLRDGLRQEPYCLEAMREGRTVGLLPLAHLRSLLFGRYLIGLPYLNVGGVLADSQDAAAALVDRAVELADRLDVKYLELRHEVPVEHSALGHRLESKVHMRLDLPGTSGRLWDGLTPKVRNQVRKGQKLDLAVAWGGPELLDDFYAVFARNMRDLGTPVFGRELFRAVLERFPERAEIGVVRLARRPVAAALLIHGPGTTEVPSASSLRQYNATNANMLMYWHLLCRAIERGQQVFDFGRSSRQSNTYRFKKQWGAEPHPAVWQYYLRRGSINDMRPENSRYRLLIRIWRRLPVALTRWIGPPVVRGIP
jgi:FemAB-related protein (PEP-CTERM system-associated)